MEDNRTKRGMTLSLFALCALLVSTSWAVAKEKRPAKLTQTAKWYDGSRVRTVYLNPGVLVDLDPNPDSEKQVLKEIPGATPSTSKVSKVRIWTLPKGANSKAVADRLRGKRRDLRISPALHDHPTGGGTTKALPGTIVIQFKPNWNASQVDAWLASKGLSVVEKNSNIPNLYTIQSEAGLASLEKANELFESGEVLIAMPDWWQERVSR